MTYIPNVDKPTEADQINQHISKLYECKKSGVWDLEGVAKWLKSNLPQMADAADFMAGYIDDQFPGTEYEKEVVAAEAQREITWEFNQSMERRGIA
jgi:hypothetical protein